MEAASFVRKRLLKTPSESFDGAAQDERTGTDIGEDFPFMLRHSKHSKSARNLRLEFRDNSDQAKIDSTDANIRMKNLRFTKQKHSRENK